MSGGEFVELLLLGVVGEAQGLSYINITITATITMSITKNILITLFNNIAHLPLEIPRPGRHTTAFPRVCVFMVWFAGGGA